MKDYGKEEAAQVDHFDRLTPSAWDGPEDQEENPEKMQEHECVSDQTVNHKVVPIRISNI